MSRTAGEENGRPGAPGSSVPTWWLVFSKELADLWIGGKALTLILLYTVLLGLYSYLLATNTELNLMPLREMVLEAVKISVAVSAFICMIIGADSVSGERERATLEGLLLTPTSRRQIVVGKLLAAVSPWPVALALSIPYWHVLSQGDAVFGRALLWGALLGTLLAPAFACLGLLVSNWSNTNKTSMVVSVGLYLLLLLPTELTGPAKVERDFSLRHRADLVQWANPMAATSRFLFKRLVEDRPADVLWHWLTMPVLFTFLVLILLFVYAGPRLRLEAAAGERLRWYWSRLAGLWRTRRPPRPRIPEPSLEQESGRLQVVAFREVHRTRGMGRGEQTRGERPGSAPPAWWLVFAKELRELWIGGRALNLILLFSILLGIHSYVMARDSVLSLIPPNEMVYEVTKAAIAASVFIGLIIGADSLSGERERATLEGLLLTPARRRAIVTGKFLAAASAWPVALAVSVPYLKVLSQGTEVFGQAVLWGGMLGTVLVPAFTALGMLVSFWCTTNKTSMFVSLGLYILFLLPTQLPAHAQGGALGLFFQWVNPMQAPNFFLAGFLVNNRSLGELQSWLTTPVLFAALVLALLFWYASPGLRLEAGTARRFPWSRGRVAAFLAIACLVGSLATSPATAQGELPQEPPAAVKSPALLPLRISIDMDSRAVKAGTPVLYSTVVTNEGTEPSPPLIVAMNIINLRGTGDPVDPEDWSPQRTQYRDALAPGKSTRHSWRVNAILDGDFMVYMVVIPTPDGPDATSQPVASSGIHLTVTKFTRLNPGGVLPYAIGGPALLALVIFVVYRLRRREIDEGGPS